MVRFHLAVLAVPYKKYDPSYDRYKTDEYPPSAFADVVKAAYG